MNTKPQISQTPNAKRKRFTQERCLFQYLPTKEQDTRYLLDPFAGLVGVVKGGIPQQILLKYPIDLEEGRLQIPTRCDRCRSVCRLLRHLSPRNCGTKNATATHTKGPDTPLIKAHTQ